MIEIKHIYWIAGFLDGEGSFGYNQTPQIQVTSTDEDLIGKFVKYSQIRNLAQINQPSPAQSKIQYKINICGKLAAQWMMTIYPLMCKRRQEKIKEVLLKWKNSATLNENKTHCPKGHPLSGRNLLYDTSGGRRCKICRRAANSRWRQSQVKCA